MLTLDFQTSNKNNKAYKTQTKQTTSNNKPNHKQTKQLSSYFKNMRYKTNRMKQKNKQSNNYQICPKISNLYPLLNDMKCQPANIKRSRKLSKGNLLKFTKIIENKCTIPISPLPLIMIY